MPSFAKYRAVTNGIYGGGAGLACAIRSPYFEPALARGLQKLGCRIRENCAVRVLDNQAGDWQGLQTIQSYNSLTHRQKWLDRNTFWENYNFPPYENPAGPLWTSNFRKNTKRWEKLHDEEKAHYGEATEQEPNPNGYRRPRGIPQIDEDEHFGLFWQRFKSK